MKRILYILLLLVLNFTLKAQVTPISNGYAVQQNIGSSAAIVRTDGAIGGKFVVWRFTDTTTANTYQIKNYPFALIATTTDNSLWTRNQYATAWMRGSGSSSSITNLNDSTIIVCDDAGSCDTIDLGTTNSYFFLNDSTIVTCDTVQIICVGDSCYQQQLCDTLDLAAPPVSPIYQNGLRILEGTTIREFGNDAEGEANLANLRHNTWLYTDYSYLTIQGRPTNHEPFTVQQKQWSNLSSSIASFNSYSKYPNNMVDGDNRVNLYINYFNPFVGDTNGWFGNRIGYGLITNSRGRQEHYLLDHNSSKQVGILFHTLDTANREGVTIFAQQLPSTYNFGNNPAVDSNFLTKRVAVFKTNQQQQNPAYGDGTFTGTTPTYIIATDVDGNLIEYPPGGLSGNGLLFARDDDRNNSGANMYFSAADKNLRIDSINSLLLYLSENDGAIDIGRPSHAVYYSDEVSTDVIGPFSATTYLKAYRDTLLLGLQSTSSKLLISNLNNATSSNVLYYDPTSDRVTYGTAGITGITADNGLTANTSTNIQLGSSLSGDANSPLLHNTYINTAGFGLTVQTQTAAIAPLTAIATSGTAFEAQSQSGNAISGITSTGTYVLSITSLPASTNTIQSVANFTRSTTGTATNGIGGSIVFSTETASGSGETAAQLQWKWVDAAQLTRTSQIDFVGVNSTTNNTIMSAYGTGVIGIGISSGYTATRLEVADNSVAGASIVNITSTSIAAASDLQKGINVSLSGANANSGQDTYAGYFLNSHTGTSNNNYAIYAQSTNNTATGTAIYAQTDLGAAVTATATGSSAFGGVFSSVSGTAVSAASTSGLGFFSSVNPSSTNTVVNIAQMRRGSSGTPTAGMGGKIELQLHSSTGATRTSNELITKWTVATEGSQTSQFIITGVLSGTTGDLFKMNGDKSIQMTPITATAASAITPAEGMLVFVSNTDATFTSIGIWCYQNGAWKAL